MDSETATEEGARQLSAEDNFVIDRRLNLALQACGLDLD